MGDDGTAREPVAFGAIGAYVILGDDMVANNTTNWPATDDPDEHAPAILVELALEANGVRADWRLTGGDDHGDGLTSFDWIAPLYDMETVRALIEYANGNADDPNDGATSNMGLLTGPEEYGWIPGGLSYDIDGSEYNVGGLSRIAGASAAIYPITVEAASYLGLMAEANG